MIPFSSGAKWNHRFQTRGTWRRGTCVSTTTGIHQTVVASVTPFIPRMFFFWCVFTTKCFLEQPSRATNTVNPDSTLSKQFCCWIGGGGVSPYGTPAHCCFWAQQSSPNPTLDGQPYCTRHHVELSEYWSLVDTWLLLGSNSHLCLLWFSG